MKITSNNTLDDEQATSQELSDINENDIQIIYDQQYKLITSLGNPFACPGDIIFIKSKGILSKINIIYQKLRRPKSFRKHVQFTHIGIVTNFGIVAHSIPGKGSLLKSALSQQKKIQRKFKSGITIDTIKSSGFIDNSEEILVLRNKLIFNDTKKQLKIKNAAMYYFGSKYNFLIDMKDIIRDKLTGRQYQHCSEFVANVLKDAEIEVPYLKASKVLPIDNFIDLDFSKNNWMDITDQYKSDSFDHPSDTMAEAMLKTELVLTMFRQNTKKSSEKIAKEFNKLLALDNNIKNNPNKYSNDSISMLKSEKPASPEDLLEKIYSDLKSSETIIRKKNVIEEVIENNIQKINRATIESTKSFFIGNLSLVITWHHHAIKVAAIIGSAKGKEDIIKAQPHIEIMSEIAKGLNLDRECNTEFSLISANFLSKPSINNSKINNLAVALAHYSKLLESICILPESEESGKISDAQIDAFKKNTSLKESYLAANLKELQDKCFMKTNVSQKNTIEISIDFDKLLN